MKKILFYILQVITILPSVVSAQQAEYNRGNTYVRSNQGSTLLFSQTWGKSAEVDFVNAASGTLMNQGAVWYKGNFQNDGMVGYVSAMAHYPALSYFSGNSDQTIKGNGKTTFHNVAFQGVSFHLQQEITIDSIADFETGIVTSQQTDIQAPANSVLFMPGSSSINTSDVSFVDGFVRKTGNTPFEFPIGNGGYFRPASISASAAVTDTYTARYIYADPETYGYLRSNKASSVGVISNKEFWIINRLAGSDHPKVTLSWHTGKTSSPVPTDLSKLQVVRWDGTKWVNEGNNGTFGNATTGTITSNAVTGFGVFTLAAVESKVIAVNDTVVMAQNSAYKGQVAGNDTVSVNSNIWAIASLPQHGTVSMRSNGNYSYTPNADYSGTDGFTYTLTDSYGTVSTATVYLTIKPFERYLLVHKHSSTPVQQSDATFTWKYYITLTNVQKATIDTIRITDDLAKVFASPVEFAVTGISATGNLKSNGLYDGTTRTNLLIDVSSLAGNSSDSITIDLKVNPHSFVGMVYNQAQFDGSIGSEMTFNNILTDDPTNTGSTDTRKPTPTDIKAIELKIPNGFSPNRDGENDTFVITHAPEVQVDLEVFTRWGTRVYHSTDYQNDWDGKGTGSLLGSSLLDGTYFYKVVMTNHKTNEVKKYAGFITLKR
jgi:gliding motility-associated-like protein